MLKLTEEQVKKIAEQLDCGFRCFIHRQTGELITLPDTLRYLEMDTEAWADEQGKLDNNFDEYFEIDLLESKDSFEIMADFTEQLDDKIKLKADLIKSLNKKKPFREFNFVINNSGIYRQQWFDFKNERLKMWVKNRLKYISDTE
ncbi:MAG: hypothetical protein A3F72_13035 [Bacteroidetes bacterium RIFCSPLOWO2_12_FULL_35_15]|nr:MAG: hypothetical protein A3F72_13035 [Bacteroidetes bacterium RIFCSPLOWO2_12_FULL_35_15]